MDETSALLNDALITLLGLSWLGLLYLAWPRLTGLLRRFWRRRPGKPVRLSLPPLQPRWDSQLESRLTVLSILFLALSVAQLLARRPQWERLTLTAFALCGTLTLVLGIWRRQVRPAVEHSDILFPRVLDDTALGMELVKARDGLIMLRTLARELADKGGNHAVIATSLSAFVENVRDFLVDIRLESPDSAVLRQSQPLLIRLETLVDCFTLLPRVADAAESRRVSAEAIEVLTRARQGFAELQHAHQRKLQDRIENLIKVLRQLYS